MFLALGDVIRHDLREFVVSAGMTALSTLLEQERTKLCGPRYAHQSDRVAGRAGHVSGELVMGGRRVNVRRPRVRTRDGREAVLPSWATFSAEDPLKERALEQMLIGVSTRRYERSLESLPEAVVARGASKSAVFREQLAEKPVASLRKRNGERLLAEREPHLNAVASWPRPRRRWPSGWDATSPASTSRS